MEHPNPFELDPKPEEKKERPVITGSKLSPEEMRRVIEALPEDLRDKNKHAIAESLPTKDEVGENRAGSSYLGIIHLQSEGYSKWAVVEVSFTGSLHASRTHKKEKEEGIKTNVKTFDSLPKLLDPLNLTDVVRLRLGGQLQEIADRRGLGESLRLDPYREK